MQRRTFLGMGSAAILSAGPLASLTALAQDQTEFPKDTDPIGGYNLEPPKKYLFMDLRHIEPGDLIWRGPDGTAIPVSNPPQPVVEAVADLAMVPRSIRLEAQKPKMEQDAFTGSPGGAVHFDGGVYRAWALQTIYPEGQNFGAYSSAKLLGAVVKCRQSTDAYEWTQVAESKLDVEGMTGIESLDVFIDPAGTPEERYKGVFHAKVTENVDQLWNEYTRIHPRYRDLRLGPTEINCMFGVVSPDGLHWTRIAEPLMIHKGDTDNCVYYDPWLRKYVLYTRLYWLQRRLIARAESDDFRHWSPVSPLLRTGMSDPFYFDIYLNARTNYPGLPEYHLMFPQFYNRYDQTSEVRLYSSYDGIGWDPVPGGTLFKPGDPGPDFGEFLGVTRHLIPLKDRIGIWHWSGNTPHKYPRWKGIGKSAGGWATWPEGRLCGLVADEEGEFTTFPIQVTGRELRLNARVRRAGQIRVGIQPGRENASDDFSGYSVADCDPIFGDVMARTVTWKGNASLGEHAEGQVRLHFKLRSAELFGFEWV